MTVPRRRWFRFAFSLRTLFVMVTVTGAGIGYVVRDWRLVADRARILDWLVSEPDNPSSWGTYDAGSFEADYPKVPWLRRTLGDVCIKAVSLPQDTDVRTFERVHELFPGALIVRRRHEYAAASQVDGDECGNE